MLRPESQLSPTEPPRETPSPTESPNRVEADRTSEWAATIMETVLAQPNGRVSLMEIDNFGGRRSRLAVVGAIAGAIRVADEEQSPTLQGKWRIVSAEKALAVEELTQVSPIGGKGDPVIAIIAGPNLTEEGSDRLKFMGESAVGQLGPKSRVIIAKERAGKTGLRPQA